MKHHRLRGIFFPTTEQANLNWYCDDSEKWEVYGSVCWFGFVGVLHFEKNMCVFFWEGHVIGDCCFKRNLGWSFTLPPWKSWWPVKNGRVSPIGSLLRDFQGKSFHFQVNQPLVFRELLGRFKLGAFTAVCQGSEWLECTLQSMVV